MKKVLFILSLAVLSLCAVNIVHDAENQKLPQIAAIQDLPTAGIQHALYIRPYYQAHAVSVEPCTVAPDSRCGSVYACQLTNLPTISKQCQQYPAISLTVNRDINSTPSLYRIYSKGTYEADWYYKFLTKPAGYNPSP